jgi:ABC-type Mn2+/Zn2+ transport system permease subunit
MIDFLTDPLGQEFFRRALLEVGLISVAGGALGCWVVFYAVSYAAESLAHALFPGLVIAALAGVPILVGGIPGIAVAALAIALVGRVPGIGRDAAVAVVVTGFFGLGALLALSPSSPPGIQTLLFGDILAPSDSDLILSACLAAAVVLALRVMHWQLLAVAFDRTTARSVGASPRRADVAVLVMLAGAVLVAAQGLGTLLAVAALVGPAATARVLTHRIRSMMIASSLLGIAAGATGLYLSYYAGLAAGAAIAGCIVVGYLAAIGFASFRSLGDRLAIPTEARPEAAA